METCKTDGAIMTLPFYSYHTGMFLRDDIYEDPTEQANFMEEYGYELAPPVNNEELTDQAEFFTRSAGEELKGVPLEKDMNGMTMQASAYQANDEFSTYLWGNGGDYVDVIKDDSGAVTEYVVTKENTDLMVQTMKEYVGRVEYASPGVLTANFDFVIAAVSQGDTPIVGMMYGNCFAWAVDELNQNVVPNDPDARLGIYSPIGKGPYTGAWSFGVAAASDNQEAAYWLVRYLSSLEAQTAVMKEAGQLATRSDVLDRPYVVYRRKPVSVGNVG
ncbi:MAG: extracellular solute-binding protein [Actinomycetota bacterium]|nr:extracellular solute-binding protein [Actinomycetota bacterium]